MQGMSWAEHKRVDWSHVGAGRVVDLILWLTYGLQVILIEYWRHGWLGVTAPILCSVPAYWINGHVWHDGQRMMTSNCTWRQWRSALMLLLIADIIKYICDVSELPCDQGGSCKLRCMVSDVLWCIRYCANSFPCAKSWDCLSDETCGLIAWVHSALIPVLIVITWLHSSDGGHVKFLCHQDADHTMLYFVMAAAVVVVADYHIWLLFWMHMRLPKWLFFRYTDFLCMLPSCSIKWLVLCCDCGVRLVNRLFYMRLRAHTIMYLVTEITAPTTIYYSFFCLFHWTCCEQL